MPSGDNAVRFETFEEALARNPKKYGRVDLLCGGWPCQDNSIAGTRKGHTGKKSGLWIHIARCLRLFKPKWFIGENVPGFLSVNDGRDFRAVRAELQEIGYGISWRVLNSQYFGVAQRRRRLFIVGCFGRVCPPEILFEQKSSGRNNQKNGKMEPDGLCISTHDGERQDPSSEKIVAQTIKASDYQSQPIGQFGNENNLVANTIETEERGVAGRIWESTYIAQANPNGKGTVARVSNKLDTSRGIVIGNAVTVDVAEWIGCRIVEYEKNENT